MEFVAHCSHARGKFVDAKTYESERDLLLDMLKALYDIGTRATNISFEERKALRQRESTIILIGIHKWLDTESLGAVLPKSDFAEGLRYRRNYWRRSMPMWTTAASQSITTPSNA